MNVSGFTFVRDAIKFGYPAVESIQSMIPLCDEVIVVVGRSSDETLQTIRDIDSPKIKIIETVWDDSLREGGRILAQQTDIALSYCQHEWCFYLQADEVLHEKFYPAVRRAMKEHADDHRVEGLLFDYVHFYGSYWTVGTGRRWYRREVRIVRNRIGVQSHRDAQGFRRQGEKLHVKHTGGQIYHYGWAKPPEIMTAKQKNLDTFWHPDDKINEKYSSNEFQIFQQLDEVEPFTGTHPAVMGERVRDTRFPAHIKASEMRKKKNFFRWIEDDILHTRLGEYKNYKLI